MASDDSDMSCITEKLDKLNEQIQKLKEEHHMLITRQDELECQFGKSANRPDTEQPKNSQTNDVASGDNSDLKGTTTFGTFRKFVKGLVSQTSLHGLPNIANSSEKWVAVFWVMLLLVGTGMAGWQLVDIFTEYFRYPVLTITDVYSGNQAELPEVTICNNNAYLKSLVETNQITVDEYVNYTDHFHIHLAKMCPEELRIRLSHNLTDFIAWIDSPWSNLTYTQHPVVVSGNCYSFLQTLYRNDTSPFINLEVNLNTKEYQDQTLAHEGFLNLREKGVLAPYFGDADEVFTPGYVYEIFPEIVSIVRLNGKYANCQDDEKKIFEETGMKYSQKACKHIFECKRRLSVCGCIHRTICVFPNRYKISNVFANASDCDRYDSCEISSHVMPCNCKPRCFMKEYKISRIIKTKRTAFFTCIRWPQCRAIRNDTEKQKWMRQNVAEINIEFSNPIHTEYRQVPAYPLSQFLPDIGGTLGLYLGVSLLTLAEIPQLLIGTVVFLVKRKLQ